MGANNFINHENGIFVLPTTDFDQMKEWMLDDEFFEEIRENGLTDEDVYEQLDFENERNYSEFLEYVLKYELEQKGMKMEVEKNRSVAQVTNGKGQLLAEVSLKSGYYDGVQLIVETDPHELLGDHYDLFYNDSLLDYQDEFVKSKLNEVYSKHNKTMFKVISNCTTQLNRVGGFSDGTAVYEVV